MSYIVILSLVLVLSCVGVGIYSIKHGVSEGKLKKFLGLNVGSWAILFVGAAIFFLHGSSMAAETAVQNNSLGLGYLAAALSTGLATIGAGIAVGISASAALGAISEEPKLLAKTLIFVGLGEGVAIYGLIISILIIGRLG